MAYVTDTDFYAFSGVTTTDVTFSTAEVTLLIARAQKYIEEYTGRVFQCDSASEAARYFSIDDVEGRTLYLDQDLNTLVSIVAGTDSITSSNYVTEPRNDKPYHAITLKDESASIWTNTTSDGDYENAITITAQWAYSSDVPKDIEYATLVLTRFFYKRARTQDETADRPIVTESGAVVMPTQIPGDVMEILNRYKRLEWRA